MRSNYKSASVAQKEAVERQLLLEINLGHYVDCDEPPWVVSSIGAIPKANLDVRIIHDLSRPGGGINSFSTDNSVSYSTLDDTSRLIKPRAFLI